MITLAAGMTGITSDSISSAGLALGIALLVAEHYTWYRGAAAPAGGGGGKKGGAPAAPAGKALDPKALLPFWSGIVFGTLMVACPAGLLGTAAGVLRWGGNGISGTVMSALTGQDPQDVAAASAPALDTNGALVVTLVVLVLWLLRKKFGKPVKGKFKKGMWAGALLGIGSGVFAMIGQLVIPGANSIGGQIIGGLVHGTFV